LLSLVGRLLDSIQLIFCRQKMNFSVPVSVLDTQQTG
jgi:hypothetical protein